MEGVGWNFYMNKEMLLPHFVQEMLYLRNTCAFLLFSWTHSVPGEQDSAATLSLLWGVCYSVPQQKCVSVLELRIKKPTASKQAQSVKWTVWMASICPSLFDVFHNLIHSSSREDWCCLLASSSPNKCIIPSHGWQHNFSQFYWKVTTKTNVLAHGHFQFWFLPLKDELWWSLGPN